MKDIILKTAEQAILKSNIIYQSSYYEQNKAINELLKKMFMCEAKENFANIDAVDKEQYSIKKEFENKIYAIELILQKLVGFTNIDGLTEMYKKESVKQKMKVIHFLNKKLDLQIDFTKMDILYNLNTHNYFLSPVSMSLENWEKLATTIKSHGIRYDFTLSGLEFHTNNNTMVFVNSIETSGILWLTSDTETKNFEKLGEYSVMDNSVKFFPEIIYSSSAYYNLQKSSNLEEVKHLKYPNFTEIPLYYFFNDSLKNHYLVSENYKDIYPYFVQFLSDITRKFALKANENGSIQHINEELIEDIEFELYGIRQVLNKELANCKAKLNFIQNLKSTLETYYKLNEMLETKENIVLADMDNTNQATKFISKLGSKNTQYVIIGFEYDSVVINSLTKKDTLRNNKSKTMSIYDFVKQFKMQS